MQIYLRQGTKVVGSTTQVWGNGVTHTEAQNYVRRVEELAGWPFAVSLCEPVRMNDLVLHLVRKLYLRSSTFGALALRGVNTLAPPAAHPEFEQVPMLSCALFSWALSQGLNDRGYNLGIRQSCAIS
jgi:hypothetical protein